ncbi:MAG TPA: AsnC family transcriptional regulator [Spirochaetia bacterium]|nr:AsnC family transcriptional regulator [Spirochaetia bacterium]
MDDLDRRLLNLIQDDLPLVAKPYRALADALQVSEEDVIARLSRLRERRVIRRLGAIFDSRRLGYQGVLCALRVPAEQLEQAAAVVNSYPGVTHNYLRDHNYNMWFTLLAPSPAALAAKVREIRERTANEDMLVLPAKRVFKIKVNFELDGV